MFFAASHNYVFLLFRDGMLKMRDVYVQNTALGDPASLDKQLEENAQQLDKLKQELHKFEVIIVLYCIKICSPNLKVRWMSN